MRGDVNVNLDKQSDIVAEMIDNFMHNFKLSRTV